MQKITLQDLMKLKGHFRTDFEYFSKSFEPFVEVPHKSEVGKKYDPEKTEKVLKYVYQMIFDAQETEFEKERKHKEWSERVEEMKEESETESVFLLTGSDVSKIEHYENVQIIDTNRAVMKIQV